MNWVHVNFVFHKCKLESILKQLHSMKTLSLIESINLEIAPIQLENSQFVLKALYTSRYS